MGLRLGLGALGGRKNLLNVTEIERYLYRLGSSSPPTAKVVSATATTLFQLLLPPSSVKGMN